METPTELQLQTSTVVRAVQVTEQKLAVALKKRIGHVTDETVHQIWHDLAQDLGWIEHHHSAPQRVESTKAGDTPSTAEAVPQDASKKRKASGESEGPEGEAGLEDISKQKDSGRRAGKKQRGHRPSEIVEDTNESAVAIIPQPSRGSVLLGLASHLLAKSKPTTRATIDYLHGFIRAQSQVLVRRHGASLDDYESTFFDMVYTERVQDFIREMADEVLKRTSTYVSVYDQRMAKDMGFDVQNSLLPHQPPSSLFKRAVEKAIMMTYLPETEMEEAARLKGVFAQSTSEQERKEMEVLHSWAKRVQYSKGLRLMVESSNRKLSIP